MSVMRAEGARGCRYGIEATRVPRVTAREASHAQPAAADDAEALDGFEGVLRAARVKAARRPEQRAHRPLVHPDQERGEVAHCSPTFFHSAARLACSTFPVAARAAGRTLSTTSTGGISP